jgi:hypothetical protein
VVHEDTGSGTVVEVRGAENVAGRAMGKQPVRTGRLSESAARSSSLLAPSPSPFPLAGRRLRLSVCGRCRCRTPIH